MVELLGSLLAKYCTGQFWWLSFFVNRLRMQVIIRFLLSPPGNMFFVRPAVSASQVSLFLPCDSSFEGADPKGSLEQRKLVRQNAPRGLFLG